MDFDHANLTLTEGTHTTVWLEEDSNSTYPHGYSQAGPAADPAVLLILWCFVPPPNQGAEAQTPPDLTQGTASNSTSDSGNQDLSEGSSSASSTQVQSVGLAFKSQGEAPINHPSIVEDAEEGDIFFYWITGAEKWQMWIWKCVECSYSWHPVQEGEQIKGPDGSPRYLVVNSSNQPSIVQAGAWEKHYRHKIWNTTACIEHEKFTVVVK
ncbi:hypothetical protein F5J12DRAFT_783853 [Pisolithus orientalis]|uniref:uncharacterized protein n=1 Tax=Pisolithus orientalis TaxID=936130 RepID=UPI0022255C08|nr:uncharacterized protein F5J12DRAFT_783853 [Pisolithus orientalis]KAI6002375.1 hypothetical protein F5J12DRAFT_783853 [Pisolithus orientalis]